MLNFKLTFFVAAVLLGTMLSGCQSGGPGPAAYGRAQANCPPGPKPCPRTYPEFPLPPGGPYLTTPAYSAAPPAQQGPAGPSQLNLNDPNQSGLTVKTNK